MTAPNYNYGNGEHYPCHVCGGPVLRRRNETARSWKQRACCSRKCAGEAKGDAPRHRVLARDLPLRAAQIAEWPEGIRFEDAVVAAELGHLGLPPLTHSPSGTFAAACASHRWAEP